MHTNATKLMIDLSKQLGDDPIAAAVRESTESEIVVGKLLRAEIEAAGFTVRERQMKVLTQVEVFNGEELVASGTSSDARDAIVHAALGYLRERAA